MHGSRMLQSPWVKHSKIACESGTCNQLVSLCFSLLKFIEKYHGMNSHVTQTVTQTKRKQNLRN